MGLDTRAYRKATDEWRQQWVNRINEAGERPRFWGLAVEQLTEPVTLDDAPLYHQEGLDELPWPGGLTGGMLSSGGTDPSFRGKVYDGYVEAQTGLSLYAACEDLWQGEVLEEVARKLRASVEDGYDVPRKERKALARWFEVCVEHDLVVGGDY